MNIIFLDIDGVLWGHAEGCFHPQFRIPIAENLKDFSVASLLYVSPGPIIYAHELDPIKIGMLAELINTTNTKVVLSSSWRVYYDIGLLDMLFHAIVPKWKIGTIISKTPSVAGVCVRGLEISDWLENEGTAIKNYAILDDHTDAGEGHEDRFVHTDTFTGLTYADVVKVMNVLKIRKAGRLTSKGVSCNNFLI